MFHPLPSRSRGQALAEFALAIPMLLLLLMGILDFGRAIYAYNAISNAAREGVRTAIVNQTPAAIRTRAAAQATALSINPTSTPCDPNTAADTDCVNVEFRGSTLASSCNPSTGNYGCVAVVTVKHTFNLLTPVLSQIMSSIPLSSTSRQPIESLCIDGVVICPVP